MTRLQKIIAGLLFAAFVAAGSCHLWGLADKAQAAALNYPGTGVSPSQMFGCNQEAQFSSSTSGNTELVAGNATQQIYVCGYVFWAAGSTSISLVYGTGATCSTPTTVVPPFSFTTQTGIVDHMPIYAGLLPVPFSNNLCVDNSGSVAATVLVYYTQF